MADRIDGAETFNSLTGNSSRGRGLIEPSMQPRSVMRIETGPAPDGYLRLIQVQTCQRSVAQNTAEGAQQEFFPRSAGTHLARSNFP